MRDAPLAADVHDGEFPVGDLALERADGHAAELGGGFVEGVEEGGHSTLTPRCQQHSSQTHTHRPRRLALSNHTPFVFTGNSCRHWLQVWATMGPSMVLRNALM